MTTIKEHYEKLINADLDNFDGIPRQFIEKNLSWKELYAWDTGDGAHAVRETEKAVLYSNMSDFGAVELWVPKSLIGKVSESERKSELNFVLGGKYNEFIKAIAKENGVKIGSVKKTQKIIEKLETAGIDVPTKEDFANMPYSE